MSSATPTLLAINGGSSSIRFALHGSTGAQELLARGKVDRIGQPDASFSFESPLGSGPRGSELADVSPELVVDFLLDWLADHHLFDAVVAVGHRVVHGMNHSRPERVDPALLAELHRISPYSPEHLPREIELIQAVALRHPALPQVACFDTAFHQTMPRVAAMLPIPRKHEANGVRRYGFHGLSYAYLMQELERIGEPAATSGAVILAHLGSGASMAAVRNGRSVDTTMGFTPGGGMMMATRSGDLDPGIAPYLARTAGLSTGDFFRMTMHESGLLGVSGTSPDMRQLLAVERSDIRAAEAISLFCHLARKSIGALAASLGGLQALVFSGGIGSNNASVRQRICQGLGFLGIELDPEANATNAVLISPATGPVRVRVIATDEERVIVRLTAAVLG